MSNLDYHAAKFLERINSTIGVIEDNIIDEALTVFNEQVIRMGVMPETMSMGIVFNDGSFCVICRNGAYSLAPADVLSYLVTEGERVVEQVNAREERIRDRQQSFQQP